MRLPDLRRVLADGGPAALVEHLLAADDRLLAHAVRVRAAFLAAHPDELFAVLYDALYWADGPALLDHYRGPRGGLPRRLVRRSGRCKQAEAWRREHEDAGGRWLRRALPPAADPVLVLTGHHGGVAAMAIAPDERWLVSGCRGGQVSRWDLATGAATATATGLGGILAVAISPDGSRVASAGRRVVRVHDAGTLAVLDEQPVGQRYQSVWKLRFLADNRTLLYRIGGDGPPGLWPPTDLAGERHVETGTCRARLVLAMPGGDLVLRRRATAGTPVSAVFGPGAVAVHLGDRLAVHDADGAPRFEVPCHVYANPPCAFDPGGTLLATVERERLVLRDAATGAEQAAVDVEAGGVFCAPDGRHLVAKSGQVYDRDLTLRTTLPALDYRFESHNFAPAGGQVVLVDDDDTLALHDLDGGVRWSRTLADVKTTAFHPTGDPIAVATYGAIHLLSAADGSTRSTIEGPIDYQARWDDAGARLVAGHYGDRYSVFDARTGDAVRAVALGQDAATFVAFAGEQLVSRSDFDNTLRVVDPDGRVALERAAESPAIAPGRLAFSTEAEAATVVDPVSDAVLLEAIGEWTSHTDGLRGDRLATCDRADGSVSLWSLTAGARTHRRPLDARRVRMTGDGRAIFVIAEDHVRRWEPEADHLTPPVPRPAGPTIDTERDLAVASPDGRVFAAVGEDHRIHVRDLDRGAELAVLRGHTSVIQDMAFLDDGRTLVSAAWDHTLRVWSLERPDLGGLTRREHDEPIEHLVPSPDGVWLASTAAHETWLWHAPSGTPAHRLPARSSRAPRWTADGSQLVTVFVAADTGAPDAVDHAVAWDRHTGGSLPDRSELPETVEPADVDVPVHRTDTATTLALDGGPLPVPAALVRAVAVSGGVAAITADGRLALYQLRDAHATPPPGPPAIPPTGDQRGARSRPRRHIPLADCSICRQLGTHCYADLLNDEALPAAADQLVRATGVLRCPECGTYFGHHVDCEPFVHDATLARLPPTQALMIVDTWPGPEERALRESLPRLIADLEGDLDHEDEPTRRYARRSVELYRRWLEGDRERWHPC